MMNSIKITFHSNCPTSATLREYEPRTNKTPIPPDKPKHNKIVIEFEKRPITKPLSQDFFPALFKSRSQPYAEIMLRDLTTKLRDGQPISHVNANQLADALERILKKGESTDFLYGQQDKAGRPPTDMFTQFMIFLTIEDFHSRIGRYGSGRNGQGAYDAARNSLQEQGMFLEIDALRKIRREVIQGASKDASYLTHLIQFMEGFGYRVLGK